MPGRDVLQDHHELRVKAVGAMRSLAGLADERESLVTVEGQSVPRSQLLLEAADRLEKNQFTLAIVGEFSRGKSSLINVLLETKELLPTSIEPSTAAITVVSYGPEPTATVRYKNGTVKAGVSLETLRQYVVGTGLDGSDLKAKLTGKVARLQRERKVEDLSYEEVAKDGAQAAAGSGPASIQTVQIQYPSPFLEDGIRLVDTPGIGSVNPEHGEATRGFIHEADAVIFLINTDPVISASECNFLAFLQDYVNRFLFAVTKIDRFTQEERDQSVEYTRKTITDYAGIQDPPMFPVSAKLAQVGREEGDLQKIEASGFPSFINALDVFLIRERGQSFVRDHVTEALSHLDDLRNSVEMELQTIDLNLGELQEKLAATQPELEKARTARSRIMTLVDKEVEETREMILGEANIDWMRLSYSLQQEVQKKIEEYDWDQLQQASELLPIFVRDYISERLREKLETVSDRLSKARAQVIEESRTAVHEMNQNIGFEFQGLRPPRDLDLQFDFDPSVFSTDMKKVGTITIGSTLALTLGSVFLFGGVGAVVILGGLLAGTKITSVFRGRVRKQLMDELKEPLNQLVERILSNIGGEVERNLVQFRNTIGQALDNAISNVEETLKRLQTQMSSAEFNTTDRRRALMGQRETLDSLSNELELIAGPGW